jgi:hypothetical protein
MINTFCCFNNNNNNISFLSLVSLRRCLLIIVSTYSVDSSTLNNLPAPNAKFNALSNEPRW